MHLLWLICVYVKGSVVENTLNMGNKSKAQGDSESQQSQNGAPLELQG